MDRLMLVASIWFLELMHALYMLDVVKMNTLDCLV
jgi:hypothetical protein